LVPSGLVRNKEMAQMKIVLVTSRMERIREEENLVTATPLALNIAIVHMEAKITKINPTLCPIYLK
jgi:hypothetical protein